MSVHPPHNFGPEHYRSEPELMRLYDPAKIKLRPNVTLNLGLRYEYEGGLWDPEYRLPQRLDLGDPIPGMADAIDPRIPPTSTRST